MASLFTNPTGIKMEVSQDGIKWYKRVVVGKFNGQYSALQPNRKTIVLFWNYCREIE